MASVLNFAARRYLQTAAVKRAAQNVQLGPSATAGGHEGGYKIWKKLTFFVAFPTILLCAVNVYLSHQNEHHERPPFVKYEYMAIRSKRFPWGDGQKSLFHNPHVNALPTGYEDEH